jgi:hypothetical protein
MLEGCHVSKPVTMVNTSLNATEAKSNNCLIIALLAMAM